MVDGIMKLFEIALLTSSTKLEEETRFNKNSINSVILNGHTIFDLLRKIFLRKKKLLELCIEGLK